MTIDLDALLAPIELAQTPAQARSAVWPVLRMIKRICCKHDVSPEFGRALLLAVDAVAWAQGCSEAFRSSALSGALVGYVNGADDFYSVIPATFPATVDA